MSREAYAVVLKAEAAAAAAEKTSGAGKSAVRSSMWDPPLEPSQNFRDEQESRMDALNGKRHKELWERPARPFVPQPPPMSASSRSGAVAGPVPLRVPADPAAPPSVASQGTALRASDPRSAAVTPASSVSSAGEATSTRAATSASTAASTSKNSKGSKASQGAAPQAQAQARGGAGAGTERCDFEMPQAPAGSNPQTHAVGLPSVFDLRWAEFQAQGASSPATIPPALHGATMSQPSSARTPPPISTTATSNLQDDEGDVVLSQARSRQAPPPQGSLGAGAAGPTDPSGTKRPRVDDGDADDARPSQVRKTDRLRDAASSSSALAAAASAFQLAPAPVYQIVLARAGSGSTPIPLQEQMARQRAQYMLTGAP
jgi:hypothetical protein